MNNTKKSPASIVVTLLIFTMVFNLASCGTILYPERRNQPAGGKIDVGVAVLDGIGLLFFIVPGVVAFAVDFSNNSIYLPHGHAKSKYSEIHSDKKLDIVTIENIVRAETGKTVDLQQSNVGIIRLDSASDLDSKFDLYNFNNRIASAF
jgi:hypothetical protein